MNRIHNLLSPFLLFWTFAGWTQSPVKWLNKRCNVNIDTTSQLFNPGHAYFFLRQPEQLNYRFTNEGKHVTFVDSNLLKNSTVAKPGEQQTVQIFNILENCGENYRHKKDTTIAVPLPFYYEGATYRENVFCDLTFGKSKMITHGQFVVDVTDTVAKLCSGGLAEYPPSLRLIHYFKVKNTSKKTILCTKELITYNDTPDMNRYGNSYVEIKPEQSYSIPVSLLMDRKYRFKREGYIEVFSDGTFETHPVQITSTFVREK